MWRLSIETDCATYRVCGTEEVLQTAVDEWNAWREVPPGIEPDERKGLTILGMEDNAERSPLKLSLLMCTIKGMSLAQ